jgi:catechol 2,3-dioxygenase-like lactoylglutathione lyase family enzyme
VEWRIDDLALARRFAELGLAGFVLKSHYAPTAERAAVVRGAVPGVRALGAVTLNHGIGGLNAQAVEIAARVGARIVWLPTVDAENEAREHGPGKQPVWRVIQEELEAAGVANGPVRLDPDGLARVLAVVARHDLTYTRDATRTPGRLHHVAFFVDQREDVLRAADIFLEHGIVMESGPHKHAIQQTFFLYTWEPGGNRIEVCSGGYLIFAPDHEAVVWSQAERAKGQAWGMQTVATFHIKGTPPVPEEEALLAAH